MSEGMVSKIVAQMLFYAPTFEEVGGAYCFWDVFACVRPLRFFIHSITSEPCMLGF